MNIVRIEHSKERPYLIVSKKTVCDSGLSFEARGFLMYLLTKPDDWRVRPEQIAEETGLSSRTVYRLLRILISARYVLRGDFRRRKDGRFQRGTVYIVYEERQSESPGRPRWQPNRAELLDGQEVPF